MVTKRGPCPKNFSGVNNEHAEHNKNAIRFLMMEGFRDSELTEEQLAFRNSFKKENTYDVPKVETIEPDLQKRISKLEKHVKVLLNAKACLEHVLELDYLAEGGSTEAWVKAVLAECEEFEDKE